MFNNSMTSQRKKPGMLEQEQQQQQQQGQGMPAVQPFQPLSTPPMRNLTFPQVKDQVALAPRQPQDAFGLGDTQDGGIPFGPVDPNSHQPPDIGSMLQQLLSRQGRR